MPLSASRCHTLPNTNWIVLLSLYVLQVKQFNKMDLCCHSYLLSETLTRVQASCVFAGRMTSHCFFALLIKDHWGIKSWVCGILVSLTASCDSLHPLSSFGTRAVRTRLWGQGVPWAFGTCLQPAAPLRCLPWKPRRPAWPSDTAPRCGGSGRPRCLQTEHESASCWDVLDQRHPWSGTGDWCQSEDRISIMWSRSFPL